MDNGTFIAFEIDKEAIDNILLELENYGFKHLLHGFKPHITLITDRKDLHHIDLIEFDGYVKPIGFKMFKSPLNKYFLSLIVESKEIVDIHNRYSKEYDIIHPYEEFIPHITFSINLEKSIGMRVYEDQVLHSFIENISINLPKEIKVGTVYREILK